MMLQVFRASSGLRSPERPPQRTDQSADLEDGEHGEHSARLPLRDDFDGAGGTDAIAEEEEEEVAESRPDPVGPAHRDRADASQGHEDDDVDDDELADPQASYVFPEQKSTFKPILKRCVFRALPASLITGLVLFVFIMLLHIINLREDEQLVVPTLYGEWIRNGPGTLVFWPHQRHEGWEIRKVPRIATLEFAVLKNRRSQELRHILGPGLVWRREMEDMDAVRQKFQLQKTQYHRLVDSLTGEERVVRGPLVYAPEPLEHLVNGTEEALMINAQESVLVENRSSGILRVVEERGLFYPKPYEFVLGWRYPILVEEQLYAVVKNELNGSTFVQEGPVLLMLGAYEQLLKMKAKVVVRKDEYLRLVDRRTGVERVVHGPAAVAPALEEDMPSGVGKAALLTPNTAAIVLDHSTGQQHLRTVEGLLMPAAYEEILEIRSKIRVLAHQALFTRAPTGVMTLHTAGSFFLQPYDDIFSMQWSVYDGNTSEPAPKEEVTVVDLRTNRLPWKYIASTKDNVRLQLEGATLWGVVDPMTMAQSCEDAPGDILQRSRAALLSALGRVQLREFTSRVAEVTNETAEALKTDAFVVQRGLEVSGISVTRIEPVDTEVAEALQTMIKAVTQHVADMQSTETADVVEHGSPPVVFMSAINPAAAIDIWLHVSHASLFPLFEVVHWLLVWLSKRVHRPDFKVNHNEWANLMISNAQALISGSVGAYALLYEEPFASTTTKVLRFDTSIDTVHGYSRSLEQVLPFILAYFAYDLLNMTMFMRDKPTEKLMLMHHGLCLLIWPLSFHYRAGNYYVLYFIAAELSTSLSWTAGYFLPLYGITGAAYYVIGTFTLIAFTTVRALPSPWIWWSLLSSQSFWADVPVGIYAVAMLTLPLPSPLFLYWWSTRILRPWIIDSCLPSVFKAEAQVSMTALQGNLRIEQIRSDLIRARAQNDMLLAVGEGQAQGKRMAAEAQTFLDGLEDSVNASSSRLDLYRSYHEELAVNNLTKLFADGPSKLYLHSNDTEIILHKAVRRNRRLSTLASGTSAEPPEPRAAPPPSKACTVEAGTADSSDKAPTCAAP
eukprot:s29_g4.t3